MRVVWNELTPNDRYVARIIRPISYAEMGYVTHLYLPLIGFVSHSLYQLLVHEVDEQSGAAADHTHRGLMAMLSLPLDKILAARERLEAMGLLDVRRRENRAGDYFYEYLIKPPLTPYQFFQEDIWSIMLFNQIGKVKYEQIRRKFADKLGNQLVEEYPLEKNVTKSFREVYHGLADSELAVRPGSETETIFNQMKSKYPPAPMQSNYEAQSEPVLDLSFLRYHLPDNANAEDVMALENIEFLYKLMQFYQLKDWIMGRELNDWNLYDPRSGALDKEALRKRLLEKYAEGKLIREQTAGGIAELSPGNIPQVGSGEFLRVCRMHSPLAVLEAVFAASEVSKSHVARAEGLLFTDGLSQEVVNALLLLTLRETNMELPDTYIKSVRDNWKAKQVTTAEDAVRVVLERSEARSQAADKQKTGAKDTGTAPALRRGKRNIMQDKLPASVLRQLEREQELEKDEASTPASAAATETKGTLVDDPELKDLFEALRKSQKGGRLTDGAN